MPLPPRVVDLCSGRGWDTTFRMAHFPLTEYRVRRDPADRTTLITAGEQEVPFVLTPEVAPPLLVAAGESVGIN